MEEEMEATLYALFSPLYGLFCLVVTFQAHALFRAVSVGEGVLGVILLQVGSSPGAVWRSESPFTMSLSVRVVPPVSFRLLPSLEISDRGGTEVSTSKHRNIRRLVAPLLLAPGSSFPLEPEGGSGI